MVYMINCELHTPIEAPVWMQRNDLVGRIAPHGDAAVWFKKAAQPTHVVHAPETSMDAPYRVLMCASNVSGQHQHLGETLCEPANFLDAVAYVNNMMRYIIGPSIQHLVIWQRDNHGFWSVCHTAKCCPTYNEVLHAPWFRGKSAVGATPINPSW